MQELPPRIAALSRRGVSRIRLSLQLKWWKLSYRLRVLALRGRGADTEVVAANSPETVLQKLLESHGELLRSMIQGVHEEMLNDKEVLKLAQETVDQRARGLGRPESPIVLPTGYGGAAAVADIRGGGPGPHHQIIDAGYYRQLAIGGALRRGEAPPGTESYLLTPGTSAATEAMFSPDPAHMIVGGAGSYKNVLKTPPDNPILFAQAVHNLAAGAPPPPGISAADLARAPHFARLSHVERGRGFGTESLMNYLAGTPHPDIGDPERTGKPIMSFGERYGAATDPAAASGANQRLRESRTLTEQLQGDEHTPRVPGLPDPRNTPTTPVPLAKARSFLEVELGPIRGWLYLQMVTQSNLFDREEAMREYIVKHMRDHVRALLYAKKAAPMGVPEIGAPAS
jgi:hypothetical protein